MRVSSPDKNTSTFWVGSVKIVRFRVGKRNAVCFAIVPWSKAIPRILANLKVAANPLSVPSALSPGPDHARGLRLSSDPDSRVSTLQRPPPPLETPRRGESKCRLDAMLLHHWAWA